MAKSTHGSVLVHEGFDELGEERREVMLSDLGFVRRYLEAHVDLDLVEKLGHLGLFRVLTEPAERSKGSRGQQASRQGGRHPMQRRAELTQGRPSRTVLPSRILRSRSKRVEQRT